MKKSESGKTLAVASGTFVVQRRFEHDETPGAVCQWFESSIFGLSALRRVGNAEATVLDEPYKDDEDDFGGRIEVRCAVEYGPVYGAYESDLERQLAKLVAAADDSSLTEAQVFDYKRRALTEEDITTMAAKVHDTSVPLSERKRLETLVRKLS